MRYAVLFLLLVATGYAQQQNQISPQAFLNLKSQMIELTLRDVERELQGLLAKAHPDEVAGVVLAIREITKGLRAKEMWDVKQDLEKLQRAQQKVPPPSRPPVKRGVVPSSRRNKSVSKATVPTPAARTKVPVESQSKSESESTRPPTPGSH